MNVCDLDNYDYVSLKHFFVIKKELCNKEVCIDKCNLFEGNKPKAELYPE